MTNDQVKSFALALLTGDSEEEVIEILKKAGYWQDPSAWRLYGDLDGNFATVGNQQARPEAALVEKIVNSVDARLLNECLVKGIDPESKSAPKAIREAISRFFDDPNQAHSPDRTIADWSARKQLEQAKKITVAVTGSRPRQGRMPCITIADAGEGQSPGRFPDTFMSMTKANKLRIPFVQGKFNMGGTGVLKFCGRHSLQLVISRRHPAVVEAWKTKRHQKWTSADGRADQWGVTVVRRERPTGEAGEVRNSMFKYLAPIGPNKGNGLGEVLSFSSSTMPIFPDENRAYDREAEFGTVIKLYEYDMKSYGSHALMKSGLLFRLEALLPHIALPVRIHECRSGYRGEEARSFANSLVGLTVRLTENKGDNLEEGFPTTSSFVVRQERMTAQVFAFKPNKAETYRTNEGVIFAINGQSHGAIPKTMFERTRVRMGRIATSLLIVVDCSHLSVTAREDLFMNSRDRLSAGEFRKEIEEEIEAMVRDHPGLRELRDRRRSEEIANRLEESKPLETILDSIIKTSPTLTRLFRFGQRLNQPHRAEVDQAHEGGGQGGQEGTGKFESKPHPTYFRFHKLRPGETLVRTAEVDRRCRIKFETDAPNDYFERAKVPGRYDLEVLDGSLEDVDLTHSVSVSGGIANWSIKFPEDKVDVGDSLTIQCTVTDDTLSEPFVNVATITLVPHQESGGGRPDRTKNTSGGADGEGGSGTGKGGGATKPGLDDAGGLEIPPIFEVKKGSPAWDEYGFDDLTACKVIEDDVNGQSRFSFYINVDNLCLKTEQKGLDADAALEQRKFVWGNLLIGLALIHDDKQRKARAAETDVEGQTVFARIEQTTRALAPFLLPMIDHLGAISEEDVVKAAQRGDDE
jgi:hypothetical protein